MILISKVKYIYAFPCFIIKRNIHSSMYPFTEKEATGCSQDTESIIIHLEVHPFI